MARNENGRGFSLKDALFNQNKVVYLASQLAQADPQFDADSFIKKVMTKLKQLALKERISWIADCLEVQLPEEFGGAAAVIVRSLPPPLDPTLTDNDFGDFIFAPLSEYVVRHGCNEKHLHTSLRTLEEITQRFSAEEAIRYFITSFETETLAQLAEWTSHRHYHVRRLVSEGTRPLLPWAGRISIASTKVIPLLDQLYFDPTRYVTRSVANHINDISKIDPGLAVATLERWLKAEKQDPAEMEWIIRHGLRTLVKKGDARALRLLGYRSKPRILISDLNIANKAKTVSLGEALEFSFVVKAHRSEKLMIDYVIDFQKANGTTAAKVFKLKKVTIGAGEEMVITKQHRLLKNSSTLKFYGGTHTLRLQINGQLQTPVVFELVV